jgi:hypothetical protein
LSVNRMIFYLQPEPIDTRRVIAPGSGYTTIMRQWRPGETARCRLCPKGRCTAKDDICLLTIRGIIPKEAAPTFNTAGLTWEEKGGAR